MQSLQNPSEQDQATETMEQASAVRELFRAAEDAWFFAGELVAEVEDHGRIALAFLKAWVSDPCADPSSVRESFARVELVHHQLGGLIDQQRRALDELPARLAPPSDPERAELARQRTLAELELEGVLGGHQPGREPRDRPRGDEAASTAIEE